eukprot:TRINITY_DN374_c0_g1_i7.p3 TRINITY_DN374_c0_g1~~TRINITY_DN374_c0_g1_i7.p3  ORF type:complete len:668 (+),score=140.52 TRINITY_DN374_c0_g1_i7:3852-5855(+)
MLRILPESILNNAVANLSLLRQERLARDILAKDPAPEQSNRILVEVYANLDKLICRNLDCSEQLGLPILTRAGLPADKQGNVFQWEAGECAVVSAIEFDLNFQLFTRGLLANLDWSNVAVCGGSVLACLLRSPQNTSLAEWYFKEGSAWYNSDIDLFLVGLTKLEALEKIRHIYAQISSVRTDKGTPCVVRTKNAITIVPGYPYRNVQIIMKLFKSAEDVLCAFDLDCVCFTCDGSRVYGLPRALRAVSTRCNMVDVDLFRSFNYSRHLRSIKYWQRGFTFRILTPAIALSYPVPEAYLDVPTLAGVIAVEYKAQSYMAEYDGVYIPSGPSYSTPQAVESYLRAVAEKNCERLLRLHKIESRAAYVPFYVVGTLEEMLQPQPFSNFDEQTFSTPLTAPTPSPPPMPPSKPPQASLPRPPRTPPLQPKPNSRTVPLLLSQVDAHQLRSKLCDPEWYLILAREFDKPYFTQLEQMLTKEWHSGTPVYPEKQNIFRALNMTPYSKVKVVIIGQDPYVKAGQADGLCFSVPRGVRPPPSLRNIFVELQSEIPGFEVPCHGCLDSWAKQGVLLLNATLTVSARGCNSHSTIGWQTFTDNIVARLNERTTPLVFILLGKFAQNKCKNIWERHYVLRAAHPSPMSAPQFFGCGVFARVNEFLCQTQQTPINWAL